MTQEKLGDETVQKIGTNNNVIRGNTPENPPTYIYLNEKTYNDFFDENGILKDEVPEAITIFLTGNLNDKILNITKPINIISQKTFYNNITMIISKTATKTNITNAVFNGEKTKIIIQADECNMEIEEINIENMNPLNMTIIEINGNKNNITITDEIRIRSSKILNSNITISKITTGKQNKIEFKHVFGYDFNELIVTKLENTQDNQVTIIDRGAAFLYDSNKVNPFILNNSNNNRLKLKQLENHNSTLEFTAVKLINSSDNYISGTTYGHNAINANPLILENNSNNNKIIDVMFSQFMNPIKINNSHQNKLYANTFINSNYDGFTIKIEESVGNIIKYNALKTANLWGDRAVLQENINDTVNNLASNNTEFTFPLITKIRLNMILPETIKINQTFTMTANVTSGIGSRAKPLNYGVVHFIINGEEIATANVVNGIASTNYTLNEKSSFDTTMIEFIYQGNKQNETQKANGTIVIEKLNTNIIMPNVVNDGLTSTLTTLIRNENGNIINDGLVVFKVDNMDVGVVDIVNGIAQIKVNTSKYALGVHNFTATYLGNDMNAQSTNAATLTIIPFNANIKVDSKVENNKATLIAEVCDIDGNAINNGRVVFKLNGKTLKDANGNTIYVNVRNGVATATYILPEGMAPKDYILTAVSSDKTYNRVEVNSTLTVPKTTPKVVVENNTVKRTNNTTITVKLTDNQNNNIKGNTKVAVKLNGVTVQKTTSQNGMIILNMDLTKYKNSQYDLTIVSGENNRYNTARMTSKLTIE
ncbi:Ig-like domain-containing protein [Methanosphaera cuniculi]|uniref:Ig-like domain-containing protein n=1 Tax=Methanosphaera cuniculi TaxID=1077256 RepID=UPI0026DBA2DC|nr:Ig-like domain-containing protein [Methanosphaera cuniculi]